MKNTIPTMSKTGFIFKIGFLLIVAFTFSACGQKGPLEIEQPLEKQEQEEEQAPTI